MNQNVGNVNHSHIEVSKAEPCLHCGKPDWCYRLKDNISVCKRQAEPASGWYKTEKQDKDGDGFYATVASRDAFKQEKTKKKSIGTKQYTYQVLEANQGASSPLTHLGKTAVSQTQVVIVRNDYEDGSKEIKQFTRGANGKASWTVAPELRAFIAPYTYGSYHAFLRLYQYLESEDLQDSFIFIPEGEKCVDVVGKAIESGNGYSTALTNYGGGGKGKWKESDTQYLVDTMKYYRGEERKDWQNTCPTVVLMPDGDKVGLEHGVEIYKSLVSAGIPAQKIKWHFVSCSNWDSLPGHGGKDIADMMEHAENLTVQDIIDNLTVTENCPWLEKYCTTSLDLLVDEGDDLLSWEFTLDRVTPDIDWFIQDLLPMNRAVVLSGDPATGKSVSMVDLAAAVASGGTWLGKQCKQGKVLILNSDQSENILLAMGKIRTTDDKATQRNITHRQGWTASDENLDALRRWIKKYQFDLVIMDSIRECICHPLDIDQNAPESGYKLKQVAEIVLGAGGSFIAIHHNNKSREARGTNRAAGSTSIISGVDAHWDLSKNVDGLTLRMPKVRGYSPVEVSYQIDFKTGICHPVEPSVGGEEDEAIAATKKVPLKVQITDYLSNVDNGVSVKELAQEFQVTDAIIRTALNRLTDDGIVETTKDPESPRSKLYRLVDEEG